MERANVTEIAPWTERILVMVAEATENWDT
jgi:hypothetical protein